MLRHIHIVMVAVRWASCRPISSSEARAWHEVSAANAPSKRYQHTAVLDSQQRMWVFGGTDRGGWLNDLHYFDVEARAWHEVSAANATSKRIDHTAVLDSQQRMWVFGGRISGYKLMNDLHYFDVEARAWHEVSAANAPSKRDGHTAVLDSQQRMWVFGGRYGSNSNLLNDLHYFDIEARAWHEVAAANAPSKRDGHTAVLDSQQRMWVFGGWGSYTMNALHYFDVEARAWHEVAAANAPAKRYQHTAVLDSQQRMWVFAGFGPVGYTMNALHYFDVEVVPASLTTTPASTSPPTATTSTLSNVPASSTQLVPQVVDCSLSVCPDGHIRKNTSEQIAGSASGCCEASCLLFTCPRFYVLKEFAGKIIGRTYDACCDRSCAIFPCPWGYVRKTSPHEIKGTSYQECCDETCQLFECPAGYIPKGDVPQKVLASKENCCALRTLVPTRTSTSFTTTHVTSTSEAPSLTQPTADSVGHNLDEIKPPTPSSFLPLETSTSSPIEQPTAPNDSPPEQTASLIPIVVPVLVASLAVCLSVFCFWAKKLRGRAAPAEPVLPVGPVLPSSSHAGSILPVASSVKPLIFAWDARMTAEWPRGKVLKLAVGEREFEARGQRYQFQHADHLYFSWADGTVQQVERIDRNVVHWVTSHPRPAWQHFRWICIPQCAADGLHDMDISSEPYRCKSCSRSGADEKHWWCPVHEVHLCFDCAELPPEGPTLGVGASFLVDVFPPLARSATGSENPNFYEMCPRIAHGDQGLGFGKTCPRDDKVNCSIVDALEDAHSGKVTHFVSWCWGYTLTDVVTAVNRWLRKRGGDPSDIFLWICFFCNNQYRIIQEETQTGSDDLKGIFEKHLAAAGHMLILLNDIRQPTYVSRAWCIFESYVCIQQKFSMEIILPNSAQDSFRDALSAGASGIEGLTEAIAALDVRDAKASQRSDEDLIKRLILTDIGFDAVNDAVRSRLVDELLSLFREMLMPRPR